MTDWSKYLATGVPVPAGASVPQRKEIRALNEYELHVYIEGLAAYQNASRDKTAAENDPLSYYKIAGIHGLPYETWPLVNDDTNNGVPIRDLEKQGGFGGFCTHSSVIFLTWHRPYLALFEQTLYKYVVASANAIPKDTADREKYITAAKYFRMPYWDWARPASPDSVFPRVALTNELPKSKIPFVTKDNPLYSFRWPDDTPDGIVNNLGDGTVRWPGQPNTSSMQKKLRQFFDHPGKTGRDNLVERVGYLLSSYKKYASFSHNGFDGDSGDAVVGAGIYGSLEDVHNMIHNDVGQGGQMADPDTSAFDPIFWLHHTNIDRLFAIWQGLWQTDGKDTDTWVTEVTQSDAATNIISLGWKKNDPNNKGKTPPKESATTKLYPFRPNTRTESWYDSNAIKQVQDFGYTYEEVAGTKIPVADKTALKKMVSQKYPTAALRFRQSLSGNSQAETALLPKAQMLRREVVKDDAPKAQSEGSQQVFINAAAVPQADTRETAPTRQLPKSTGEDSAAAQPARKLKDLVKDNKYLEWLVNIKAEKHALGGTYSVGVFLGPPDEVEPSLWTFSPHYVGSFAPFGRDANTGCAKCQDAQSNNLNVTGQIPLTLALMERYLVDLIPNMDEQTVSDYLVRNLHWRVRKDGQVLEDRSQLAGLTVFVVTNGVTLPQDESELPVYEDDVVVRPEITTNRDGTGRGNGTGLTAADM